jgi:hypothetical protein
MIRCVRADADWLGGMCDDIIMNMITSVATKRPPLRVMLPPKSIFSFDRCHKAHQGLGTLPGREDVRSVCTRQLLTYFKDPDNVLIPTRELAYCPPLSVPPSAKHENHFRDIEMPCAEQEQFTGVQKNSTRATEFRFRDRRCPPAVWMPPIRHRTDLGYVLKHLGAKRGCIFILLSFCRFRSYEIIVFLSSIGVEIGVEGSLFFESILQKWRIAALYVLVAIRTQPTTNLNEQLKKLENTKAIGERMKAAGFLKEYSICRNFTPDCVKKFPDSFFDFIYVDARLG